MSTRVDTAGVYRAEIAESAVNTTKKSGYPQFVARYTITEKYIEDPEGLAHFELESPGWVDWSAFDEEIVGYSILFKADVNNDEVMEPGENDLPSYESLQRALDWDGTSFATLASAVGKKVLIRVDEDEFEGKVSLRVNWVDHVDSPPRPELRGADKEELASLDKLLKVTRSKSKPAPAKPAPASKPKPGDGGKPKSAPPAKQAKTEKVEEPAEEESLADSIENEDVESEPESDASGSGLPASCSQGEAWEFVCDHKGDNDDGTVQDAWLSAVSEIVGEDGDEDDLDETGWASVLATVVKDLDLKVS